jgi:hypothetical protein
LKRFLKVLFSQSVKHSLRFSLDLLNGIKTAHFSFNSFFGNRKMIQGVIPGEYGVWKMTAIYYFARNCWVRPEV